jgi:tetratricopeptide (TPR) repeat protein
MSFRPKGEILNYLKSQRFLVACAPRNDKVGAFFKGLSVYIVLAIAILAVFWQVKDHDFINLDDNLYITENPHVQAGLTIENVKWAFTTTHAPYWHPLTWLSHMLDIRLFGLKAGGHHAVNVLFHIANTLLLFLILGRMTKARWQSAFVAALFALHPLHVESVAWVAERKDVLSTLFWMLTMWAYAYYRESPGYRRYLLVIVAFTLGLMSKPMLVTLPFVLLLLDFWPLGRLRPAKDAGKESRHTARPEDPVRKKRKGAVVPVVKAADWEERPISPLRWTVLRPLLLEKAPLLVLAALSSVITIINQQKVMASLQALPVDARIANALVSYVKYLGMMVWPIDLAVFYPHPHNQPVWLVLGAALALAVVTFLVIRKANRFPYLCIGWLWYLGTLVPVIGLFQAGPQEMADRFTYVPMIGVLIMVAWGIPDSLRNWGHRKIVLGAVAGITILTCAGLTRGQVQLWRDSITLFAHTLKVTTGNYITHNNMGTALSDQGKIEEAITHYRSALRIAPRYAKAWNNLGIAYEASDRSAKAIEVYQEALRLDPNDAETWSNLGSAYGKSGQSAKAIEAIEQALRIDPTYDEAWNNLGNAYGRNGETAKAIEALQKAIRINPRQTRAWNNLGIAYAESGRTAEAIEAFQRSLGIKPGQADVWSNLAVAYRKRGRTTKAIEAYREALRINPRYVNALFGLGTALAESGQAGEAEEMHRRLRTLDPAAAEEFSRRVPLPVK